MRVPSAMLCPFVLQTKSLGQPGLDNVGAVFGLPLFQRPVIATFGFHDFAAVRLSQTPAVWRELDEWIRHRLRAIQLKQWKRGTTTYRELRALGANNQVAQKVAGNTCRWWHNSRLDLNRVLNIVWFDRLGLVRLS